MAKDKDYLGQLSRILSNLGDNPDRVAEVLRANGCRGFQGSAFPGPVIRYLYYWFDEGSLSVLYSDWDKPDRLVFYGLDGMQEMRLPLAVSEFLQLFDKGAFPDLDLNVVGPHTNRRA